LRTINLIGAPSSAGAYAPGQEKAPTAFRRHGLVRVLEASGWRVNDLGDTPQFRWRPDRQHPKAMNIDAVRRTADGVAERVAGVLGRGESALVVGGDCTIELGSVAGAIGSGASIGLVYVDLDVDLNAPATSDGALDWTGVAHLLDIPGAAPELSGLAAIRPMLKPDQLLFFAAGNITEPEAATMRALQLRQIPAAEVAADPRAAAERAVQWAQKFELLLVHLDVDVLDYADFPIAENVRRGEGLSWRTLDAALTSLLKAPNWRVLTVAEVNPDHAPDENEAFSQLVGTLGRALSAPAS
jgi:arginase